MMIVPGKLDFCQEKLETVLPAAASERAVGGAGAAVVALCDVAERRCVVPVFGVAVALGGRRRRTGGCCSSDVFAGVLSSAAGASTGMAAGAAEVRPLPITVYPAGTETLT